MSLAGTADSAPPRWLTWGLRLLALGLGALHTAIAVRSQSMNEDGINYLDLGDAWWQGNWADAINTTWSPLYAWILGAVINLTQPSIWWEFPTVQITNFVLYAVTLVCFEYFWRQLSQAYYADRAGEGEVTRIPPALWATLGYSLFIYVSLNLVQLWAVTPDMCVAALVYLAAGRLLALGGQQARPVDALWLGLVLGLGYLAKAALFPLGLVGIALAVLIAGGRVGRGARLGLALGAFLVVAAPWIAAVSSSVGHLSFSDVSRFTYLKHVNQMPWPQWQEAADRIDGTPLHPPRQIHDDPPVWEFATPIGGTYPLAYDPAWWTRGLEPRVEAATQLAAAAGNLMYYFDLFVRMQGGFLAVTLLLLVMSHRSWRDWLRLDGSTALVVWSLTAFGLYALVYAEARYFAPFVLLLWAAVLVRVRFTNQVGRAQLATVGGALLTLLVWVNIGTLNLEGLAGVVGFSPQTHAMAGGTARGRNLSDGHGASHPQIAAALREMGLKEGDRVAFVGYSYSAYWARLARLEIVAEIRPEYQEQFWSADYAGQSEVLRALSDAGAVAVLSEQTALQPLRSGWWTIGGTGFRVMLLPKISAHRPGLNTGSHRTVDIVE